MQNVQLFTQAGLKEEFLIFPTHYQLTKTNVTQQWVQFIFQNNF